MTRLGVLDVQPGKPVRPDELGAVGKESCAFRPRCRMVQPRLRDKVGYPLDQGQGACLLGRDRYVRVSREDN